MKSIFEVVHKISKTSGLAYSLEKGVTVKPECQHVWDEIIRVSSSFVIFCFWLMVSTDYQGCGQLQTQGMGALREDVVRGEIQGYRESQEHSTSHYWSVGTGFPLRSLVCRIVFHCSLTTATADLFPIIIYFPTAVHLFDILCFFTAIIHYPTIFRFPPTFCTLVVHWLIRKLTQTIIERLGLCRKLRQAQGGR